LLVIDFVSFVARNCTNNCLKLIIKNKFTLTKAKFAKEVIFKKILIIKKKLVFESFIKLTLTKFRKTITIKFNIKNFANTRDFMLVSKILQVYILLTLLLLIFTINFVLFRTISLIIIVYFIRLLRRLLILCYVESN